MSFDWWENRLDRIERSVSAIALALNAFVKKEGSYDMALKDQIDRISADMQAQKDLNGKALTLIQGMSATLAELRDKVEDDATRAELEGAISSFEAQQQDFATQLTQAGGGPQPGPQPGPVGAPAPMQGVHGTRAADNPEARAQGVSSGGTDPAFRGARPTQYPIGEGPGQARNADVDQRTGRK